MATLNTSSEGAAITRAYQAVVDTPLPAGGPASSPTYGNWVVYSVQAPLASAFQNDSGKESVLKVFRTGEGELIDLVDEFSEGKIQFAFVKVKDPNSSLAKSVLVAWCGEGVPERTKGYFTSHLAAVSNLLHGYHVQVTARSDNDLAPEAIIRKVADSSGSKYSGDSAPPPAPGNKPAPPVASKPVFTPSRVGGNTSGFNPLGARTARAAPPVGGNDGGDGWGDDAPPVTRSQIQKVDSAYKPTRVNMADLTSQKPAPSRFQAPDQSQSQQDVVRGGYQPIGKVDIAAIRKEAQEKGDLKDDRPAPVKGSYEPIGKVDINAIKARAQGPSGTASPPAPTMSPARTGASGAEEEPKSMADRSAAFTSSERMTSMPKPKVSNRFGGGGSFAGTRAPAPETKPNIPSAAPVGAVGKNFADEGGKTPAQIWAEKKARERGNSGAADTFNSSTTPIASQASGGGQWESGYSGKKWGSVQTGGIGRTAAGTMHQDTTGDNEIAREEPRSPPAGNVSSIADRFKDAPPMGGAGGVDEDEGPPPMDMSSKPNASRGVPMPGLPTRTKEPEAESPSMPPPPPQPPRSPTPEPDDEVEPSSPIRVAQPVGRGPEPELSPAIQHEAAPEMPMRSMAQSAPTHQEIDDEPQSARANAAAVASPTSAHVGGGSGQTAVIQYDYEKAEDNELELKEGEYVVEIEMVDDDWWMGTNPHTGEKGLFPSNYVELVEEGHTGGAAEAHAAPVSHSAPAAPPSAGAGKTAIAQYDYEAAEENELSFPDGATITNVEFPDDDWWLGEFNGHKGLFPANYVELNG